MSIIFNNNSNFLIRLEIFSIRERHKNTFPYHRDFLFDKYLKVLQFYEKFYFIGVSDNVVLPICIPPV